MEQSQKNQQNPGDQPAGRDREEGTDDPVSSQSLFDAEMSVGEGAVTGETDIQENKEADPDDLT